MASQFPQHDPNQQIVSSPENFSAFPVTSFCLQNPSPSLSLFAPEIDTTEILRLLSEQPAQPTLSLQTMSSNVGVLVDHVMEDGDSSRAKKKFKGKGWGDMSKGQQDDWQPSRSTEMHKLSERRRRGKIAEKIKALQEVLPNLQQKGRALVLDEAIEYIKTLKHQVQMMAMERSALYQRPVMEQANYPGMGVPWMSMNPIMGTGLDSGSGANLMPWPPGMPLIRTASGSVPTLSLLATQLPQIYGSGVPPSQMQIPLQHFHPQPAVAPSSIVQTMFFPAFSATLDTSRQGESSSQIAPRDIADDLGMTEGPAIPIIPEPSGSLHLSTSVAENLTQMYGFGVPSHSQIQIPFDPFNPFQV